MSSKEDKIETDSNNKIFSEKNKNLLSKLLKEKFDSKLLKLEKNTKKHLLIISQTLNFTKYTTSLSIAIEKQIQEKISKLKIKYSTPNKNHKIQKRFSSIQNKTPMQRSKSNANLMKKNINNTNHKNTKINYNNTLPNKITPSNTSNKNMNKRVKSYNNLAIKTKTKNNNHLRRPSQTSTKSNKSNNNLLNNKISNSSNTYINRLKNNNSSNKNNTNVINNQKKTSNINKKIIKKNILSKSKNEIKNNMSLFENSLQNITMSLNNDSLLFSPLKDLDYFSKSLASHKNLNGLLNDASCNIQNKLEYFSHTISKFDTKLH